MNINNLSKSFGENLVLNNISYTFPDGKVTCIMGKSGCGKTTLLNIIMGFISPDSGEISPCGKISAVFQEDRLCSRLNAIANVKLACNQSETNIIQNLNRVGLENEDIFKPVSELSGGMKRRTAIVRAIMAESDIIIMDEAFKGIDASTRKIVADYVLSERKNRTLIFVTHDIDEVEMMGGTLIEMQ